MPLYEYQCRKCGHVTTFIERIDEWKFWRRKCEKCRSRKLNRLYSSFSVKASRTTNEMLNELNQMGNVQFVPQYPMPQQPAGPPPGGCPFAKEAASPNKSAGSGNP
jgi:putative FmdB family regulatory protein